MKDKIKKPKEIDDYTYIFDNADLEDTFQCPNCMALFNKKNKHECKLGWKWCSICGLDLHKKSKPVLHNGIKYITLPYKKSFKIIDKIVCWNCVFNLVKQFKSSN